MKHSEEKKAEIAKLYLNGENTVQLSKKFKISRVYISRFLDEFKIDRRDVKTARRTYDLNEKIFENITEESAYWIGFLMADGCVSDGTKGTKKIFLGLHENDKTHIEKFTKFLGCDGKIYKNGNIFNTVITSDYIVNSLEIYGIVPRKSIKEKVFILENNRHFWRGVIDGDGSLSSIPKKISVCGSYDLMTQFNNFISSNFSNNQCNLCKHGKIFTIQYKKLAFDIVNLLYGNCSVYLNRKYDIAKEIMGMK